MKKGFTLTELLVTVLIVGILAAVALPVYKKAVAKARAAEFVPLVDSIHKARGVYPLFGEQKEDLVFYESGWNYDNGSIGEARQNNLDKLGIGFPDLEVLEQKYKIRIMIRTLANDPGLYLQIEPTGNGQGFMFGYYEVFQDGYRTFCKSGGDIGNALAQMYHCEK